MSPSFTQCLPHQNSGSPQIGVCLSGTLSFHHLPRADVQQAVVEGRQKKGRGARQDGSPRAEEPAAEAVGNGKHSGYSGDVYEEGFSVHSIQAKNLEGFTLNY